MTVTLRCWIAGLAMALSALVITATSDPRSLGPRAIVLLLAVFAHAWVIAVGERCFSDRGGNGVRRFPLGSRLVSGDADLLPQFLVPAVLLGVATRSWSLGLIATAIVLCLSVSLLRRLLPLALPILWLLWSLVHMQEFHTLGDLIDTTRGWVETGVAAACWALVLGGPLLRTDVGGDELSPRARGAAVIASLPGYLLAFWLFSRTGLATFQADVMALSFTLLAGGTVQTLLISSLGRTAELSDRDPYDFPDVDSSAVGLALMPLTLPLLAVVAFGWVPLAPAWRAMAVPEAWAGLLVLMLIVPAVPAAVLVGASLDRLDGRDRGRRQVAIAGACFALWFVFGPMAVQALYAPSGGLGQLVDWFPGGGPYSGQGGGGGEASLGGTALGGDLTLFALPAADLCRAATLMMLGVAALAARWMRHASRGLVGVGFGLVVITWALQALCSALLMPRMGPTGVVLGTTLTCLVMLAVDTVLGERVADEPDVEEEEEDLLGGLPLG